MFKKLFLVFTLSAISYISGMEPVPMDIDQDEVTTSGKIASLQALCMDSICENIEKFTPEHIAALSVDARNIFMQRAAVSVIGKIPCNMVELFTGHTGPVYAVCKSHDNKIITASHDATIRIWERDGTCIATCKGHTDAIWALCVTPDNKIISGSDDRTIRVWNMQGEQLAIYEGHEDSVTGICLDHDNHIVSCSADNTIRIWNMATKESVVCKGHTSAVWSVCVTQENNVVSCSLDCTIRVWNIKGEPLVLCNGHTQAVTSVCMSHDNKIISSSNDWSIRMWELNGTQSSLITGHKRAVSAVRVMGDNTIVSSSVDKRVRIWDQSGEQLAKCVCLSPIWSITLIDENTVVAACENNYAYLFDISALHYLKNTTPTFSSAVWAFLQELTAMHKTGYVAKLNPIACWERIKKLKEEDDQKNATAAEPDLKRNKSK